MNHTKLIEVFSAPTTGQFVRVWSYEGRVYSDTVRYSSEGRLETYDCFTDSWAEAMGLPDYHMSNMKYFKVVECV